MIWDQVCAARGVRLIAITSPRRCSWWKGQRTNLVSTAPVVGEVLFVRNHSKMHLWTMGMVNAWWKAEVEVAYLFSYVNPSAAMTGSSITSRVNILSAQPNFSTVQKHRNKRHHGKHLSHNHGTALLPLSTHLRMAQAPHLLQKTPGPQPEAG